MVCLGKIKSNEVKIAMNSGVISYTKVITGSTCRFKINLIKNV